MIDPARYLPFADPGHEPDWLSRDDPDLPRWLTTDEEAFMLYCIEQLGELDRRANRATDRSRAMLDMLWQHREVDFDRHLPIFLDIIGWTRDQFETARRRKLEEYSTDTTRTGPTLADPQAREGSASALAAHDIAKLRFVIFPRFWGRKRRKRPSAEAIAARRQGCSPTAAESWYENEGVNKQWSSVQA